jgi:hypothetical protein
VSNGLYRLIGIDMVAPDGVAEIPTIVCEFYDTNGIMTDQFDVEIEYTSSFIHYSTIRKQFAINRINVVNSGSGYKTPPRVEIDGMIAVAQLGYSVSAIDVVARGNYQFNTRETTVTPKQLKVLNNYTKFNDELRR